MTATLTRMRPFLLLTDIGFLLYWSVSLLVLVGINVVPKEYLFNDYENPIVQAWNWSFFPIDILLSVCGLLGLRLYAAGHGAGFPLLTFSLALTFCAGLMAIAYWTLRLEFDPLWWIPNLLLMAWPCIFLPKLWREYLQG